MKKQTANAAASIDNIYRLDGKVPVAKAIPFGLQHVLAMFVANVAPIILVAQVAIYLSLIHIYLQGREDRLLRPLRLSSTGHLGVCTRWRGVVRYDPGNP